MMMELVAEHLAFATARNEDILLALMLLPAAALADDPTVGDTVEFGGLLGFAPVMPVNTCSNADFIARGGRIPAPLQSLKN